ncbi:MAG TPA: SulP family inorganic anion transporter [Terriglobales bacterium]|nr:SulP family inorganic anion transporter [Terriglobales bacterium]
MSTHPWSRLLPEWLVSYRRDWLRPDIVAGLTTGAVIIPMAMAYAMIAGLPVQVGLYTALVPMAIYAVLGTSRVLSVSTTTTVAILTAAQLGQAVPDGNPAALLKVSVTLTLLVGAALLLACLLRLGSVANFISEPVLVGFRAGIGLVIVVDQIPKVLGIHFTRGTFVQNVLSIVRTLPKTSLATLAVGLTIILFLLIMKRFLPKLPAPLLAVAAAITGAYFLHLQHRGVELVGDIPPVLPSLAKPDLSLIDALWPGALGIALMSFTETVAAGRAFTRNDEPAPRADRELIAIGLANVGGALLGAMPGGGGTTQTAVNVLAGARTRLAGLITVAITLVTILFLAPLIAMMPQAALAALVVVYSSGLIKPIEFHEILNIRRTEFSWAIVAFAGVVLVGTLKGIIVAIIVSLVTLAYHVADPPVYVLRRKPGTNVFRPQSPEHPEDESFPGLLLLRPEGPIFFANAAQIAHKIEPLVRETQPKVVAVDASGVLDMEYTALKIFAQVAKKQRQAGIELWLIGMNPGVLAVVQRSPLGRILRRDEMHFNLEIAVRSYLSCEAVSEQS